MKLTIFVAVFGILLVNASLARHRSSAASIAGHIVDLYGSPLSGAVIEISGNQTKNISVRSDNDGGYLINNLPDGMVAVTAVARGFRPETRSLTLRAGQTVVFDVGLEPMSIADQTPVRLTGTIRNDRKAPLKQVALTVLNPFNDRLVKTVNTDSAGRYRVEFDNGGQYIVYASRSGFVASSSTVILPAAPPRQAEVNLVLAPINESMYGKAP